MIKSMTGFGQGSAAIGQGSIQVEIKSLNSKFLDLSLRLPKIYSEKELEVRNLISEKLERGKVSVSVDYTHPATGDVRPHYNEAIFMASYAELKKLADRVMAPYDQLFELALRSPDVQHSERESVTPNEFEKLQSALTGAIAQCDEFRISEGASLAVKFRNYIEVIAQRLLQVDKMDSSRVEKIRGRIRKGVVDFFGEEGFDQNRLEQEIIYYIEKLDIHEERVRLKTHLDYFLQVMDEKQSNGKKLAFIAQEIGREINTIGSKANDAGMQKEVVSMKEELEKIKEQLNNVL